MLRQLTRFTRTLVMSSKSYSTAGSPLPLDKALPAPGEGTTTLDVSGGETSVKLDHLGPLVVNTDGTMSRIGNWAELAPIEKENTLRILGKRNKARLDELKKKREAEGRGENE